MATTEDKLLGVIPVAITAKIASSFLPKEKKRKKSIFDFGGLE